MVVRRMRAPQVALALVVLAASYGSGALAVAGDALPGARDRATLRGRLTVDGAPLDAEFLGAVVVHPNGLVAACQGILPAVENGRYEITVLPDALVNGCGSSGARVVLWEFAQGTRLYSNESVRWPGKGRTATFNATFLTTVPDGVAPPMSQFNGEVFDRHGRQVAAGTKIEAYIGKTRCGVSSTRRGGSFSGYIMSVVGPDSIAGCTAGATITFRIGGKPAVDTAVNALDDGGTLDLTVA